MKTPLFTTLLLALSAASATGCAHYANADLVEEPCWNGGQTVVSSRESDDGSHHVIVERIRESSGPCDDTWRENLVYDRYGHLQARTLDHLSCGVIEHRWAAMLDAETRQWHVEQDIDTDHDDESEEILEYEISAAQLDMGGMGLAASCPVMSRLPVEVPAGTALAALGR